MKNATIEFVEPTASLRTFVIENKIVDVIVAEIRLIPNFEALRLSLDLALHVCNLIEALVEENNIKTNKQEIYIKCAQRLGWNKPDDEMFIKNSISFLHSNKAIQAVPLLKKIWIKVKHFLMVTLK